MEYVIAFVALTSMEIVLGIDNIVFIAIITGRLPERQQPWARRLGLALAMVMRILLLLTISWILQLTKPIFTLPGEWFPENWLTEEMKHVSVKDLILLAGGLVLIQSSVREIHNKVVGLEHERRVADRVSFSGALVQITLMDIIFSLDSVITAVGMVKADKYGIGVMIASIVAAVAVMLVFAGRVSRFVEKHPTLKMLALSFLILIGVMLVAEGVGTHVEKGYIYFAMAFALVVEMLNLRIRQPAKVGVQV